MGLTGLTDQSIVRAERGCWAHCCVTVDVAQEKDSPPSLISVITPAIAGGSRANISKRNPRFVYIFKWWQQGHFTCNDLFPWRITLPT